MSVYTATRSNHFFAVHGSSHKLVASCVYKHTPIVDYILWNKAVSSSSYTTLPSIYIIDKSSMNKKNVSVCHACSSKQQHGYLSASNTLQLLLTNDQMPNFLSMFIAYIFPHYSLKTLIKYKAIRDMAQNIILFFELHIISHSNRCEK